MKLTLGIAAALASCAAAAQPAADVYILPNRESSSPPSVSRSVARLITQQRLAFGRDASVNEIPDDADVGNVISLINSFGKTIPSLFDEPADEPSQLVIVLEGLTEQQIKDTRGELGMQPAFTISDPPPDEAMSWISGLDLSTYKGVNKRKCSFDDITNPFDERCWADTSLCAVYDVQKKPEILGDLIHKFPRLASLAKIGEMQTTVILLPAGGKPSGSKQGSGQQQDLRRRQAERVISSFHKAAAPVAPTSSAAKNIFNAPSGPIPACFDSLDSCISSTGNCSHQGQCLNKYGSADAGGSACFTCHCLSTRVGEDGPLTHWAGPTCAKKDISVPFWLFAGFALLMLGTLSLAVTMLYSVGEEKLPGVIGAGVSKSK
ncbi:hypothetical protein TARUN_4618 [Trichoderma arundinaceum]|uniref:Vacuolar sorting protein Vps3844 C-terminal domain-containing protein n=1 Tax=Trichoderma arundinaceum TaxID=490622 RepID=A0A395NNG6_TRIAR|nr:hypothetical protein TARUN_4618 [Trichoderma arundinaceum]